MPPAQDASEFSAPGAGAARRVFVVLSPRALSYAERAMRSLLAHSLEPLHLSLLTDSPEDKETLTRVAADWGEPRHTIAVFDEADLEALAADRFAAYPHVHALRSGHPCWRKITDPLLLTAPGQEMIVLDPDVYFPGDFRFERTPQTGVLLMWQQPNCLFPYRAVERAFAAGIPLARQVDIGIAQWRGGDLAWLNSVVDAIGAEHNKIYMHIEAVLWAAIAMHEGGRHLDPNTWICWRNTALKRVVRYLRFSSERRLRLEPLDRAKCFHAGGAAKYWVANARWPVKRQRSHRDSDDDAEVADTENTSLLFRPLELGAYERERQWKRIVQPRRQRILTGR